MLGRGCVGKLYACVGLGFRLPGDRAVAAIPVPGQGSVVAVLLGNTVYVCFEGPLGAHLKSEIRERIWWGEYVVIFRLVHLEKFNLDRVKPRRKMRRSVAIG